MISALKGDGVETFLRKLAAMMPGPWLYPEDQVSDAPLRSLAAEITREKLFERLHDELPYQTTVETDQWKTMPDGSARIEQTIYRRRATARRRSCIGEGGKTIKSHRLGGAQGHRGGGGPEGPPVPVREGARELGRRPRALSRDGAGVSEEIGRSSSETLESCHRPRSLEARGYRIAHAQNSHMLATSGILAGLFRFGQSTR